MWRWIAQALNSFSFKELYEMPIEDITKHIENMLKVYPIQPRYKLWFEVSKDKISENYGTHCAIWFEEDDIYETTI